MPASREQTNNALRYMLAQVGKPYIWGGTGPRGYDCSGLAYAGFRNAGFTSMPRTTYTQLAGGRAVSASQMAPGDGLFPHTGHVVWFIGNDRVVEAARTGTDIRVRQLQARDYRYAIRRFGIPGDAMSVSDGMVVSNAFNGNTSFEFANNPVADIQKIAEPLAAVSDAITKKSFWIRVLMFIGGATLVLMGVGMQIGGTVLGKVGKILG